MHSHIIRPSSSTTPRPRTRVPLLGSVAVAGASAGTGGPRTVHIHLTLTSMAQHILQHLHTRHRVDYSCTAGCGCHHFSRPDGVQYIPTTASGSYQSKVSQEECQSGCLSAWSSAPRRFDMKKRNRKTEGGGCTGLMRGACGCSGHCPLWYNIFAMPSNSTRSCL